MMAAAATWFWLLAAAGAGGEQHGQRPQPLAAVVDDVVGDLVDQRDVAAQAPHDHAVDVGPVVADERPQGIEGRHGRVRISARDDIECNFAPSPPPIARPRDLAARGEASPHARLPAISVTR